MENINWLSLVIATLIPIIIGFIYYHPNVFGNVWMKSLGIAEEDAKKANKAVTFGVSILMSFLLAIFMLNLNNSPADQEGHFDTFTHGAYHGAFIAIIVAMPILVTNGLFELKNFKDIAINVGYWLIVFTLMGGILDAMNHWPG